MRLRSWGTGCCRAPRAENLAEAEWSGLGLTYDLYDAQPAAEIPAFLGNEGTPVVAARMPAYRVLLGVLGPLLSPP